MADGYRVLYYQTATGRVPFRDWLESVTDETAFAAIKMRLDRLSRGLFGDHKPVGEGVAELRIDVGPGYRVYLAHPGRYLVVVLCGGDKRDQYADIKRAKRFWSDYEKRTRTRGSSA